MQVQPNSMAINKYGHNYTFDPYTGNVYKKLLHFVSIYKLEMFLV